MSYFILFVFVRFKCCVTLCPITRLYVGSYMLWCPLRFPHKYDGRYIFTPKCFKSAHVLFMLFGFACTYGVKYVLTTWVTWQVSYKRQELLTVREHPCFCGGVLVTHLFSFLYCLIMCLSLRSEYPVVMCITIAI